MSEQASASQPSFADQLKSVDVQGILAKINEFTTSPVQAWERAKEESIDANALMARYLVPSVVVGAIGTFIGGALLGKMPIGHGVVFLVASIVAGIVSPYIAHMILNIFVPHFGGSASRADIFKFIVYPTLISCAGQACGVIPAWSILAIARGVLLIAAAGYAIYLMWLGTPIMLGVTEEKRPGLFIAFVGSYIVALSAIFWVVSLVF